jgi:predicted O-methyltransferase YrrM
MEMTPQKWQNTCAYLRDVFGAVGCTGSDAKTGRIARIDQTLRGWEERARAAGLPPIAVSPDVGHFLTVLATLATSARNATGRIVEVGTLGGYSAMWMARGMLMSEGSSSPRLRTIEYDPKHAAFARAEFERAGLSDVVEVIPGAGLDVLKRLAPELGPASVDMVFLDAEKTEYQGYADLSRPMIRRGGLLVADNALGSGNWWITDGAGSHPDARARDSHAAVDAFNRAIAADTEFEASCVPIREGVMIAVKR